MNDFDLNMVRTERERKDHPSVMTEAHNFWVSMYFVELYSDRLSFIFPGF